MQERVYTQAEKDDAWNSVYSPMADAMRIVAFELGGNELRLTVITILESNFPLRYLQAVRALEQRSMDTDVSHIIIDQNRRLNQEDYARQQAGNVGKTAMSQKTQDS